MGADEPDGRQAAAQNGNTLVTISPPALSIEQWDQQEAVAPGASGLVLSRRLRSAGGSGLSGAQTTGGVEAKTRAPARRELSVEEAGSVRSMASTTSDVNSDDDAASIASRLSQIVSEQEFVLMNLGPPSYNDLSGGRSPSDAASRKSQIQYKSTSSLAVTRNASPHAAGGRLKQVRSSADVCQQAALQSLELQEHELRLTSAAQNDADSPELPPPVAKFTLGFSDSSEQLGASNDNLALVARERPPNRISGNLGQPERGDLKELETSRLKRSNSFSRNNKNAEQQQQQQQQLGAEPMLNICRSAWRLDEFEQAFKPTEAPGEAPGGEEASGARQRTSSMASNGNDGQVQGAAVLQAAGVQEQLKRQSSVRAIQDKNLLVRASKNALSLNQAGVQATPSTTSNNLQQVNNLNTLRGNSLARTGSREHAASDRRHSQQLEVPGSGQGPAMVGRQSRALSISSSIASSLDSFQSGRPFGRLASLLDPREQRRRRRHKQQQQQQAGQLSNGQKLSNGHLSDGDELREGENGCGCCSNNCWQRLKQYVPVLEWLPAYKLKYLYGDFMAGLAVSVLNISLCISAAVVAETDIGAAFRASMINTLFYALLCSSRHTAFGSWSIMSQMLLDSVRRALTDELILNRINLGPSAGWSREEYEMWHMNIIIMYTFLIGLIQLLGGMLNLGNLLSSFIPEALSSSMIAATAFTMCIGQLANMCGTSNNILWAIEKNTTELAWADLKNAPVSITDLFAGTFRWIQQIALLVKHHEQINTTCALISICSVLLLMLNQKFFQNWLRRLFNRKTLFLPFELILLVTLIIISYALNLREAPFNVPTCGPIAINFALPNVPNMRLVRELWFDALSTALISFTIVYIMARTYSNRLNYEIDSNQELIACGAGNLIGGLFDTLPATASFSRTAAQVEAGGQTQMASFFSVAILLIVTSLFGQHVVHLPVCFMSAALFFSFMNMMARIRDVLTYWRLCKVDFAIWVVTFVAILTLDLVSGFVYSFIFSILTMLYRAQNRRCYMLGTIGLSDVYVPLPKYPMARELDGIKIFQFCGPIHYVSADLFERLLRQKTRVNVKQLLRAREQQEIKQQQQKEQDQVKAPIVLNGDGGALSQINNNNQVQLQQQQRTPTHIILDFSMTSFIDSAGVHMLKKIIVDYQRVDVTVMIAALASHVAAVVKSEPPLWEAHKDRFYVTLADAVHHAMLSNSNNKQRPSQQQRRQSNVSIPF